MSYIRIEPNDQEKKLWFLFQIKHLVSLYLIARCDFYRFIHSHIGVLITLILAFITVFTSTSSFYTLITHD